ncbi:unnamed protein product [Urochloa decumbens]|uniref:F-box domain-containing protein n=1 Tax=Urochloa decumbens TaxID=240449 RepID=A0ABC9FLP7_9POAL
MAPAAALADDLIEEILLRVPPSDPARLFRAALVSTGWHRVVSSAGFRRRFREFHRTLPMLGILCNLTHRSARTFEELFSAHFVPTSSCCGRRFRPRQPLADPSGWAVLDARHGRVLLHAIPNEHHTMILWDPITDEQVELPDVSQLGGCGWNAAVVCAAGGGGCDRRDCHHGPFNVVLLSATWSMEHGAKSRVFVRVYSSESGTWSETATATTTRVRLRSKETSALVGNALYFKPFQHTLILEYGLTEKKISEIHLPKRVLSAQKIVLTANEHGELGFVEVVNSRLRLWSREVVLDEDDSWTLSRVIELVTLLPVKALSASPHVVGFAAYGGGVIFVSMTDGVFSIDPKSCQAVKLEEFGTDKSNSINISAIVPYVSFYTPVSRYIFLYCLDTVYNI